MMVAGGGVLRLFEFPYAGFGRDVEGLPEKISLTANTVIPNLV